MSTLMWVLIVLAVVALLGGGYGSSRGWGYYGWSPLGLLILIVLILALTGNLHAQTLEASGFAMFAVVNPTPPLPTQDPTTPKPWYTSKQVWLGVALTVVGLSTYFGDPLHTPTMTLASISEAVGGVAAVVLRVWFTTAPVAGTGAARSVLYWRAAVKTRAGMSLTSHESDALVARRAA